jgi:predicted  nucleic acid-binding Zn-ribbon protein
MKALVTVLVLAAGFTSVVAGCGGGKSAEEEWAGNVCTDIANWQSQVKTATSTISKALQSPGSETVSTVSTQVQSALDATRELGTNLKGDKPPSTDEGNQAKQQIDSLATQLQSTAAKAKQSVESVPEGASTAQAAQALAPLAGDLRSLSQQLSSTLSSIEASSSKLKEGFDKADSCKQFRSSS